ncbi:hypothetical protein BKA70DRAFT_1447161 [Coprinopsis sp. MPI-PUGE-AT-0042]|nr:hypothetical protein BKA70DRAFT_1447161 [Coprinopsis sp. MPI-PUGE-AT-0042]
MNANYDKAAAGSILHEAMAEECDVEGVPMLGETQLAKFHVVAEAHPPSSRLRNDEGHDISFHIRGILCAKDLPPVQNLPKDPTLRYVRNMRQHVSLTGLGNTDFDAQCSKFKDLAAAFSSVISTHDLVPYRPSVYEGAVSIDAHTRYFSDRQHVPNEVNVVFPHHVDPQDRLSSLQPQSLLHWEENIVEYAIRSPAINGEFRYEAYSPSLFRLGDIVEVTVGCVCIPIKGGSWKMMLPLKGLVLLHNSPPPKIPSPLAQPPVETRPKCKGVYLQEGQGEVEQTRKRLTHLTFQ